MLTDKEAVEVPAFQYTVGFTYSMPSITWFILENWGPALLESIMSNWLNNPQRLIVYKIAVVEAGNVDISGGVMDVP